VVAAVLALSATAAILASQMQRMPHGAFPLLALAFLAGIVTTIVGLSFVLSWVADRGSRASRGTQDGATALMTEIADFSRAVLAMCAGDRHRRALLEPARAGNARPVLLLHGILCNARVWDGVRQRLYAAGFGPVEAPDIEPLLADIDLQAHRVMPQLLALQSRSDGAAVTIVAHSMGGLIARALLRDLGPAAIRCIVTLASPHHGTALVRGLPWTCMQQMSRRSPWLLSLNARQEGHFAVPIASIFTRDDNLVTPAGSARLIGAENHMLRGIGHMGLLHSRVALDCLVQTLSHMTTEAGVSMPPRAHVL